MMNTNDAAPTVSNPGSAASPQTLAVGRGGHGVVELESTSGLAIKRVINSDRTDAAEEVTREFEFLRRFARRLEHQPFLDCPAPVRLDHENARLWMTMCAGERIDALMSSAETTIDDHLEHIARQLALAVDLFIAEFDEPVHDLAFKHILYQPDSGVVSVLDFAYPAFRNLYGTGHLPANITLGTFIGNTTYDTVRPVHVLNRRFRVRQQRLAALLLQHVCESRCAGSSAIREISSIVYEDLGPRGQPPRFLRQLWFASLGKVLFRFRRNRILENAVKLGSRRA